jgi:hypothetical protein
MTASSPTTPANAARQWVKARRSSNANACVEVMLDEDGRYHIRDSKLAPHGPVIAVSRAEWDDLCAAVSTGSRAGSTVALDTVDLCFNTDGSFDMATRQPGVVLNFSTLEYECFVDGVQNGEFMATSLVAAG